MPILQRLNRTFEGLATSLRGVENPAEAMRAILQQAFTPERRLIVVGLAGAISGLLYPALAAAATAAWKAAIALAPFVVKGAVLAIVIYNLYDALTRSTSMMDKAAAVTVALGVAAWFAYSSGLVALVKGLWAATTAKWAMIAAAKTLWGKIVALYALMGPKGWLMIAGAIGVTVAAVSILNRALAQTTAVLTGAPQLQDYADGATEGQKALTEALEESTKAARRNILSFDQVHTLQEEMGKTAGGSLPGLPEFALPAGIGDLRTALVETEEQMKTLATSFEQAGPPASSLGRVWEWLKTTAGTAADGIKRAWGDAKTALGEQWATIREWAIERWGAVTTAVNSARDAVPSLRTAFENAKTALGEQWWAISTWASERWGAVTTAIATATDNARTEIGTRWGAIIIGLTERWRNISTTRWTDITTAIATATDDARIAVGTGWDTIISHLRDRWTAIQAAASIDWEAINENIRLKVLDLSGWLGRRWAAIQSGLGTVWTAIQGAASEQWARIRDTVVGHVNGIIGAINNLIAAYNSIPLAPNLPMVRTIPARGGGIGDLRTAERLTPFAKGGIVTSPTRALIGEAGPEAVIPLRRGNAGIDAIADAVGNAVLYAMREALRATNAGQGDSREIILEVDGARLGRVILPALRNEGYRTGVVAK